MLGPSLRRMIRLTGVQLKREAKISAVIWLTKHSDCRITLILYNIIIN